MQRNIAAPSLKGASSKESAAEALDAQLSEWDRATYKSLISEDLTEDQKERIAVPGAVYPRQEYVLAVHWHPEHVPMDVIEQRIEAMFPNCQDELIIPTQHNILLERKGFAGVEVDCFSRGFNRKVQLLCHFEASRVREADVFRSMLSHTFRYRSRQLFEFIDTVVEDAFEDRFRIAVEKVDADEELVSFVRFFTDKLKRLFLEYERETPPEAIRNKLLSHYFRTLRAHFEVELVRRAENLLRAAKQVVKANFSPDFFYNTEEVIEEVRGLGGCIVIPHPEQFWPILLAEYDVDGYEVWNPQSQEYTDFLINVVNRHNKFHVGRKDILILMGDDCHMGEKTKDPRYQDPEKAGREVGVQPAWDDLSIRKSLIVASADRHSVIEEYRARLCA